MTLPVSRPSSPDVSTSCSKVEKDQSILHCLEQSQSPGKSIHSTMATKHFFPDTNGLVLRGLESLVHRNPHLALDPANRVVYLPSHSSKKVSIISGGGAGHEPAWCGYVGSGLLSAAVSGDVFASPSTKQIMAAVDNVPSDAGIILCITNYTGDNLHFGLAREKVSGSGRKVGMLRMTDDVGLGREKTSRLGRRGLAGNMFGEFALLSA